MKERPRFGEAVRGSDYTDYERQALVALDRYKRARRRPYPALTEILTVLIELEWTPPVQPDAIAHED